MLTSLPLRLFRTQWGWTTSGYDIRWFFTVTAVSGSDITVDLPITVVVDPVKYGGARVAEYNWDAKHVTQVGVENLQLVSSYDSTNTNDEEHGWKAIKFIRTSDSWVRQVTARYFNSGVVSIQTASSFITVEDTAQLDPWGTRNGGRRYSFNIDDSWGNLFQRCFARDGRHDYVSGSRTPGPNVFVDSYAVDASTDIGPHHRYATGQLYDSIKSIDLDGTPGEFKVRNRGSSGSGHGWAGAQVMFWNNEGQITCDAPNNGMNFAVGNVGPHIEDENYVEPNGIWQSIDQHVTPRSLYYAQLKEQKGMTAVRNSIVAPQEEGFIWSDLSAWAGEGRFSGAINVQTEVLVESDTETSFKLITVNVRDLVFLEDGAVSSYSWALVGGPQTASITDALSSEATLTATGNGIYSVMLTVTNSGGSISETLSLQVSSIVGGPTATTEATTVRCIEICFQMQIVIQRYLSFHSDQSLLMDQI